MAILSLYRVMNDGENLMVAGHLELMYNERIPGLYQILMWFDQDKNDAEEFEVMSIGEYPKDKYRLVHTFQVRFRNEEALGKKKISAVLYRVNPDLEEYHETYEVLARAYTYLM